MSEEKEENLLYIAEGETREEAIVKWWQKNGLDYEEARARRKIEYLRQLKEAAKTMSKFYADDRS